MSVSKIEANKKEKAMQGFAFTQAYTAYKFKAKHCAERSSESGKQLILLSL